MTQKKAVSQAPLDLNPADEVKAQAGVPAENKPGAAASRPDEAQAARKAPENRPAFSRNAAQPQARPSSDDDGVTLSPGAGRGVQQRRAAGPARAHIPANDDMPSIGSLIYALQQRPSRSPFIIALIASGVWFVVGAFVSWAVFQKSLGESNSVSELFSNPSIVAVIATIVIPIVLFWFLAILVWRAQELRLMSSAMTEVAVRLAEPDRMAEQSVASLGQTVRRQVAAMNDAISRALGRAGELEALVHNEVAALERSYTENENRIRYLINELATEREALANNSERVSEALRGVGSQVTREIAAASEKASQALSQATVSMAETFTTRGQKITAAVTAAGTAIDEKLAERGARITEQLVKHGAQAADTLQRSSLEVTRAIQEVSDRTAASISAKGNSLVSSVMNMSERVAREVPALLEKLGTEQTRLSDIIDNATKNLTALETALTEKTQSLNITLTDRTKMLQGILSEQAGAIDTAFTQRIHALETILSKRTQTFEVNFNERTKALDSSLARRAHELESSISKHTTSIRDTLEKHSGSMEHMLSRQASSIERVVKSNADSIHRAVEELAQRSTLGGDALGAQARTLKEVSATLMNQLGSLTKRFEEQGTAIMTAARTFENSNAKIDSMMEQRQIGMARLLESIGQRAGELDRMMNSYSNMLEQSLSQAELRARKVTELLAKDSAEKSQAAIKEIERLRMDAQAHTQRAVSELQQNFSSLSDQVSQQLSSLSSKFSDTTRTVKDSTRRAAIDLEAAQTELQRHAKVLPETAKQSASAMRRALQDQLSALDALSELSSRHAYTSAIASPEGRATPRGADPRAEEKGRDDRRDRDMTPHDAAFPGSRQNFDYGAPQEKASWPEEAVNRGGPAAPQATPQPQQQAYPETPRNQWSLGDLLARASEDDLPPYSDRDDSFGAPPIAAPVKPRGGAAAGTPDGMDFNMADIAAAIDERRVLEIWKRLNMGETDVIRQRGLYSRQGQVTVDKVIRRYETDDTFRMIVENYCSDFEKMLQDLSRSDRSGAAVQSRLASEDGRIYFVLAQISGRLG